jgi:hypothetical protein
MTTRNTTRYSVTFVEELPPPERRGRKSGIWIDRLKPVMELPGQWCMVAEGPYGNISRKAWLLKKVNEDGTQHVVKPEGVWEFATRSHGNVTDEDGDLVYDDDGEPKKNGALYAKYVGPADTGRVSIVDDIVEVVGEQ